MLFSLRVCRYLDVRYLLPLALAISWASTALSDEVNCAFNLEVTREGSRGLDDHRYRVRRIGDVEVLEQRYADGSWQAQGNVIRQVTGELAIYLHMPDASEDSHSAYILMLTIYRDGRAHLFQQFPHGRNFGDAWTTYGECWPAP